MNKVLLTGASGFLGKNILNYLKSLHYEVVTIGISDTDQIQCNLAKSIPSIKENYDIVVHVAGKAHSVPKNEKEEKEFFDLNLNGTINLLKSLENNKFPNSFIFISTVAVYGLTQGKNITEEHERLASDPYGRSKIEAEDYLLNWGAKNDIKIAILRPPLIAGHNAPGNLRAMINAIKKGFYANISDNNSQKSMVLAEDVAKFIPIVANESGIFHLTDGYHPTFQELSKLIAAHFGKRKTITIPKSFATLVAKFGDLLEFILKKDVPFNSKRLEKITSSLTFDDSKARELNWSSQEILLSREKWLK